MEYVVQLAADGLLLVIALAGGIALLRGVPADRMYRVYPYAVMAGMTSLLVGKFISILYQPSDSRPFQELGTVPGALYINNPGFPSDHALLASVIVLAVYALTPYKKIAYVLALAVVIMSAARVAALVHTPLDVIGGMVAGLIGGLWYLAFLVKKIR